MVLSGPVLSCDIVYTKVLQAVKFWLEVMKEHAFIATLRGQICNRCSKEANFVIGMLFVPCRIIL